MGCGACRVVCAPDYRDGIFIDFGGNGASFRASELRDRELRASRLSCRARYWPGFTRRRAVLSSIANYTKTALETYVSSSFPSRKESFLHGKSSTGHRYIVKVRTIESDIAVNACSPVRESETIVNAESDLEAVYKQYARFVWRVLRGMGVSDSLVEDAVQDVFLVVQRRLNTFDYRHSIKTWLFEIAYRVACDYRRKGQKTRRYQPLDDQILDRSLSPADSVELLQALRLLEELLEELDDDKRAILILAEIEQMTASEIAEVTESNLNTVYSKLRRARQQLSLSLAARYRRSL